MPYRIDIAQAGNGAMDQLVELGALDVELARDGVLSALMPDSVTPEHVARTLCVHNLSVSAATGRDTDSVWVLNPRPIRVARLQIAPAHIEAAPDALRLIDASAFGTGLHPTTAMCLEAVDQIVRATAPSAVLDVGTGSGVLALGALMLGVRRAVGIDIDTNALRVAAENARLNRLNERLQLVQGGPDAVRGTWSLVLANVLAAPLMEMAPELVRRVGHHGRLVLSGIPSSVEAEVDRTYHRLGMKRIAVNSRGGWVALVLRASW